MDLDCVRGQRKLLQGGVVTPQLEVQLLEDAAVPDWICPRVVDYVPVGDNDWAPVGQGGNKARAADSIVFVVRLVMELASHPARCVQVVRPDPGVHQNRC
jgi:hypothetical protein